jgi:hypothetical protein
MGLFNRLFGPKQEAPPARVREAISVLENYVRSIMSHYGEAHFQGDTMDKQMLSVYLFGGISALAMQNQMSQPQAHAIALTLLIDVFEYDPQDSAAKAQALISAAPDKTSHLYKIIHRGLDGFLHWQKNCDDGAAKDFADIMAQCRKLSS